MNQENNIKLLKKIKEEVYKLKDEVLSGKRSADEIRLDKFIDEAERALSNETLYESTAISKGLMELFGLKIRTLEKTVEKPQVVEMMVLPIVSVPSEIIYESISVEEKSHVVGEEKRSRVSKEIWPERISIDPCRYELGEEKSLLMSILSERTISVYEWLSTSKDKDEYAVRLVALGELLNSGKIRIRENGLLEMIVREESDE